MAPRRMSLSDLPDNAIAEILSHLPIKDAVRTSVLSRSWRHRWQHCPGLDVSGVSAGEVSTVLLLHSGTIRLFKAEEPEELENWQHHNIHSWLTALSRHSASSLQTLILSFGVAFNIDHIARLLPNLDHLDLSCGFNVPLQFCGFNGLRSLRIHKFFNPNLDRRRISRLISACPLLETLTLMDGNEWQDLDIVAPNLRRLKLYGLLLVDFSITNAPMLEVASIEPRMFYDDGGAGGGGSGDEYVGGRRAGNKNINLIKVFQSLASIKKLELDHYTLMFLGRGHIPERIPINLDYLRVLSMDADFGDMRAVLVTLCLLRSATNLQELAIRPTRVFQSWIRSNEVLETCDDFWEAQDHIGLFNKLETVTMSQIWGKENELGFIQFLLSKARVLKAVTISFNKDRVNGKSVMTRPKKKSVMTRLLGFPRVSCQARILCDYA